MSLASASFVLLDSEQACLLATLRGRSSSVDSWRVRSTPSPLGGREWNRGPLGDDREGLGLPERLREPEALRCRRSVYRNGSSLV